MPNTTVKALALSAAALARAALRSCAAFSRSALPRSALSTSARCRSLRSRCRQHTTPQHSRHHSHHHICMHACRATQANQGIERGELCVLYIAAESVPRTWHVCFTTVRDMSTYMAPTPPDQQPTAFLSNLLLPTLLSMQLNAQAQQGPTYLPTRPLLLQPLPLPLLQLLLVLQQQLPRTQRQLLQG